MTWHMSFVGERGYVGGNEYSDGSAVSTNMMSEMQRKVTAPLYS